MIRTTTILLALFMLAACNGKKNAANDDYLARAHELLKTTIVVDTHVDFPWHLVE